MDQSMQAKVAALRDEAFATFKALDDAVVSLGGRSRMAAPGRPSAWDSASAVAAEMSRRIGERLSQAGAAEIIMRERETPMTGAELMAVLPSKGVTIGGEKPEVNFTSSMSKSGKFRSFRFNGKYYWWLKNEELPLGWANKEAPDLPLQDRSDASAVGTNQEGGEANATAT
jgi:hypothetical protein